MIFSFVKYQGTGNDFVCIDNRKKQFPIDNHNEIARICDRNFGVGADGFICIESDTDAHFYMRYFNADGNEGSLCGNGSRCAIHFAKTLGLTQEKVLFKAADGVHHAQFVSDEIALELHDISKWEERDEALFLNTGSPHHVVFVSDVDAVDVAKIGAQMAHGAPYFSDGTNVNFVQCINQDVLKVRTFERGVEAETLSCGTGVTAAAVATHISKQTASNCLKIQTRGGILQVSFNVKDHVYTDVTLQGPAASVFSGNWEI